MMRVDQVTLQYEEVKQPTLNHIQFSVEQGERVLLLGPSGCGKSSLTYCLNGLYPRDLDGILEGNIYIKDRKSVEYEPGELSQVVGVVFQDPESQFCMLTVEDEIAFGLENIGVKQERMEERIEYALDLVGMREYRNATISSLSGGWKQKLALACVLVLEPNILILDEPTANLDPIASVEFIKTIHTLQQEQGFTLIVIEHLLDPWMPLIDRCIILNKNGHLIFDGLPIEGFSQHYQQLKEQGIWIPHSLALGEALKSVGLLNEECIPLEEKELIEEVKDVDGVIQHLLSMRMVARKETYSTDTILSAKNISFGTLKKDILKDVSIDLETGDMLAIVGPNGAGKSTLSHLLSGIKKVSGGEIRLHHQLLHSYRDDELRKQIGFVFQNPEHQFITDSVYEEIAFGLKMQGVTGEALDKKVGEIITTCQLNGLENEHPFVLSQGQKRRLSVATMIVDEQQILILDEPTFGQDAKSTEELMNLLVERQKRGSSIILVTHDMNLVHQYANKVVVLKDGGVAFDGSPEDLWEQDPLFLQEMNLLLPFEKKIEQDLQRRARVYVS
ncbi:ABC transporter ATP-binding protein [Bacillus carboniphilus]|uniref:ABC transporter ATP-binding protein n=1 Tax=Bacillus carboniphilus TaxID=86663 RepID=A0ABN0WU90_9BACI